MSKITDILSGLFGVSLTLCLLYALGSAVYETLLNFDIFMFKIGQVVVYGGGTILAVYVIVTIEQSLKSK